MPPIVNHEFYIQPTTYSNAPLVAVKRLGEQGRTPENPVYIPAETDLVGAKVIIQNASDWFYDYDDTNRGGSHRYVDELRVWLTTQTIVNTYGYDYGYKLYEYSGKNPPNYIEIDVKSPREAYEPGYDAYDNLVHAEGLIIFIMLRRWQVWIPGEWDDWVRDEIYRTETLFVEDAPAILIRSTPTQSEVLVDGQFAGYTPTMFWPTQRFTGSKSYPILIKSPDPTKKDYLTSKILTWREGDSRQYLYSITATLQPQMCQNPAGSQNETRCDDYDSVKCDAGEWIVVEKNSPGCGYPKPTAQFKASWVEGSPVPVAVTFTDESTYTPSEWHWDFGDGTTSADQNPTHAYSIKKGYDVKLRATNQSGSDTVVKHITLTLDCTDPAGAHGEFECRDYDRIQCDDGTWVTVETNATECGYPKPVSIFQATWTKGSSPLKVTFTDVSENNPTSWHWDFGDGFISGDQHTTHVYMEPGVYTPKLTASNKSGSDISNATIDVLHPCTNPDGRHGALDCIEFDRVECNDGTWEVIEADSAECGYPSPMASFVYEKVPGGPPRTYQFTDTSENFPASWSWDFGDGSTSTDQDPSHTYTNDGTYEVTLTVTNPVGDDVTISEIVVTTSLIELPEFLEGAIDYITSLPRDVQIGAAAAGIGLALILFPRRRKPRREPRNH